VFEEQKNGDINSLFDALYWALITISTVDMGISLLLHLRVELYQ